MPNAYVGNLPGENIKQFAERWGRIGATETFDMFLKSFCIQVCKELKTLTRKFTPVDTGLLKDSWHIPQNYGGTLHGYLIYLTNDATVGKRQILKGRKLTRGYKNVKYMKYVEYGTQFQPAKKMYHRALKIVTQRLRSRFNREFKKYIKTGHAPNQQQLQAILEQMDRFGGVG